MSERERTSREFASRELDGRTAVVTGATSGIGRAIAHALAGAGCRLALLARSSERLTAIRDTLGVGTLALPADITVEAELRTAVAGVVDSFGGPPDILVNNAGVFRVSAVEHTPPDLFAGVIDVNLVGPYRLVHAFLGPMRARGQGHIVTIGSIADRATFPENGAYAASKYGLRALHEVLRAESRGSGVRATLVSPGPVDTPLWDSVDPDTRPGFTPRALMLSPEAVADAVLFAVTRAAHTNVDELRLSRS